jgi:parallel beta-helix repeat protein
MEAVMRQRIHKIVIGGFVAGALVFFSAGGLSGAGGQVWHVPGDYPTIQAAVDAAGEGDTILVAPGVYSEHVVVSSRLTLRGAGPVSPVERPSASAGENVVLDGTDLGGVGIGIHVRGASAAEPVIGVDVSRFEVRNFERGIMVEWAAETRVSHNYVHDNLDTAAPAAGGDGYGIVLTSAWASDVGHNRISGNGFGGILVNAGSTDNTLHNNRIVENGIQSCTLCRNGAGINLTGPSNDNRVLYNEILGTNGRGVVIQRPLAQAPITGILVAHNRVQGNQRAGIAIMAGATGNIVMHNDARENNLSGMGPCFHCNLFDNSVGRNGGNIWSNNLGTFGIPGSACAMP